MPDHQTPGVFVEEIPVGPRSIASIATAIPAFIGLTAVRPEGPARFHRVGSLLDFERAFGGAVAGGYLHASMVLFFVNGGGAAFVYALGNSATQKPPTVRSYTAALHALKKERGPSLILFPDAVGLGAKRLAKVQQAALDHCASERNRFCILDVPAADALLGPERGSAQTAIEAFRSRLSGEGLAFGAVHGPWLLPVTRVGVEPVAMPASGAVAGVFARVDGQRGVWKAPANENLNGVVGLSEHISDADQETLNVDPVGGRSINAIRTFPGKGILIWGARTLAGNDNEWRYISVRRLFIMVEESIRQAMAFVVFEPNNAQTWGTVELMVNAYLLVLFKQGALAGNTPKNAFFVRVGLGSTMTARDIQEGLLHIEFGLAPLRPAEFITARITLHVEPA